MNKFGAQALGRSFLSLLFAGDDNQQQEVSVRINHGDQIIA